MMRQALWRLLFIVNLFHCSAVVAEQSPLRIITLGGEVTEMVHALGGAGDIIAVDTTSYWPPAINALPKVGYLRALSTEGILSLAPTDILANEKAGPPGVIKQLKAVGVRFHTIKQARSFEQVAANINKVGKIIGRKAQSVELSENFLKQATAFEHSLKSSQQKQIDVLFLLSAGPGGPMAAGNDTPADAIIKLSGGRNVMTKFDGFKPIGAEAIVSAQPQVILMTERTLNLLGGKESVLKLPGLSHTPAGKTQRIIAMEDMYLLGFGPRTVNAAAELAGLLN